MKLRLAAAAAVGLTGLAAPSAMGASITSDRDCYREGAQGLFIGTGFQPNQPIAVSFDGRQIDSDTSDALGRVSGALTNPTIPRLEQTRALTYTQTSNPAVTATRTFRETKLYVVVKPRRFRRGQRFRIRAGGLYGAGKALYAHVRGPRKRNVRVGRVRGACGKVSARRRRITRKTDPAGPYLVQFDTVKKYIGLRAGLGIRTGYTLRLIRVRRSSSLSSAVFSDQARWDPDAEALRP